MSISYKMDAGFRLREPVDSSRNLSCSKRNFTKARSDDMDRETMKESR